MLSTAQSMCVKTLNLHKHPEILQDVFSKLVTVGSCLPTWLANDTFLEDSSAQVISGPHKASEELRVDQLLSEVSGKL